MTNQPRNYVLYRIFAQDVGRAGYLAPKQRTTIEDAI